MPSAQMDYIHIISNASLMVNLCYFCCFFFRSCPGPLSSSRCAMFAGPSENRISLSIIFGKAEIWQCFHEGKQLDGSPVARIFRIGYAELRKLNPSGKPGEGGMSEGEKKSSKYEFSGSANVKRALRRAINTEMTRLTQMVPFLATTGNTTPFIGLFGTVWGIMNSFHGIGQRGSASLAVVAPGISEALIATAAGLGVAIPAVIAFNHFMQKIRVIETELHSFSADFLNILDRDILR